MPRVRKLIAGTGNTILESNSVLRFLKPDLAISVLDPGVADFKASALRYLDRVDAIVMPSGSESAAVPWDGISAAMLARKLRFVFNTPSYCPEELANWVRKRLGAVAQVRPSRIAFGAHHVP